MLKCQICNIEPQTSLLTKCCKLFICDNCRDKYQKISICVCSKPINKKLCSSNLQLFEILKDYYQGRPKQCDRCDQMSEFQCFDCNMIYCAECNMQIHNGKGFAKHIRENISNKKNDQRNHKQLIQKIRKREQYCSQHKSIYESVCQCGVFLCINCPKSHKESCQKFNKAKTYKQYKQQYFAQILYKLKKITQYKDKLSSDKKEYLDHFKKQKEAYQIYNKLIEQQIQGLKKLFEMKVIEIRSRLNDYWNDCLDAHSKTQYLIDYHEKKFNDYGRLTQRFVEKVIGLDYLEKRVRRVFINQEFFNFKLHGLQQAQQAILNMSTIVKNWDLNFQENILLNLQNLEQKTLKQRKNDMNLCSFPIANSQILLQCSQNPLQNRPMTLKSSHNQIHFQFIHLPHQTESYEIQYGVGLKMKGQQIFKKIENKNGIGVISNLNAATKYRIRMKVKGGQWGPITQVKTQQNPKFLTQIISISKYPQDSPLQILKTGIIYGSNQINFGVHVWQIKVFPPKHNDEETACISLGVSNKQQKKPIFVGTTLNYGYQKALISVKIVLNCQQNRMIISSSTINQDQIYQNLPNFPIYPAIQNKGSNPVQIQCTFP